MPKIIVLEIPPQTEPVRFVLVRDDLNPGNKHSADEHLRFLYEEHTCPTNWLGHGLSIVTQVRFGDDNDPHQIFKFVSAHDATERELDELGWELAPSLFRGTVPVKGGEKTPCENCGAPFDAHDWSESLGVCQKEGGE